MGKLRITKCSGQRAAIYLRRSTEEQSASIESQRVHTREYAAKHGLTVVAEFVDSGISGVKTAAIRKGFKQLIAAADRKDFDVILVWDLSRLTRSEAMDAIAELHPLKEAGASLVTLDKGAVDWNSIGGLIMAVVETESNNAYVQKLARGTTRGQSDLAKTGRWVAGRPPLGYVVGPDRKLALASKSAVNAIKWAFDSYLGGGSLRSVREGMANRGFEMTTSAVRFVLGNRLYTGDFVWGRNCQAKQFTYRGGEIVNDFQSGQTAEADQIVVANAHPAIVSRSKFDRIQKLFDARKRVSTPITGGGDFVLTGLLRCAKCGYGMVGCRNYTAAAKNIFYRCVSKQSRGDKCEGKASCVQQDDILQAVFQALHSKYGDEKTIKRVRAEVERQLKESAKAIDCNEVKRQLVKERLKLDKAERRLVEVDSDMMENVQNQVRTIKTRVKSLEAELKTATTSVAERLQDIDQQAAKAMEHFERFATAYKATDSGSLRGFLLEVVDHIKIDVSFKVVKGRNRYTFEGGEIVLREDASLSSSWSKTGQVCTIPLKAIA